MSILYVLVTPSPTYGLLKNIFSKNEHVLFKKIRFCEYLLIFGQYLVDIYPLPISYWLLAIGQQPVASSYKLVASS